jgi:hypothetical protein
MPSEPAKQRLFWLTQEIERDAEHTACTAKYARKDVICALKKHGLFDAPLGVNGASRMAVCGNPASDAGCVWNVTRSAQSHIKTLEFIVLNQSLTQRMPKPNCGTNTAQ